METKAPVFVCRELSKKYGKRTVVDSLCFCGYAGEIIGFLGPNGAGKTTTIKMMTGLTSPDGGSVTIGGFDIRREYERAAARIGAVVETPYLYENMTGSENLRLFCEAKGASAEQLAAMETLTELGSRLRDRVRGYSLGMKQRLGIAVALLASPALLLLDEPTNGLDPLAIRNLRAFLQKLAHEDGVCVFVSSHMLWEMEKLCDRVVIINEGRFIGEADIAALREQGLDLESFYVQCVEKQDGEATGA